MALIVNTLPASTSSITFAAFGGIELAAHPASIDLVDFGVTELEARSDAELRSAIDSGLCTLTIGGVVINDTNSSDELGDETLTHTPVSAADNSIIVTANQAVSVNVDTITNGGDNLIQTTANGIYASAPNASTVTTARAFARTSATGLLQFGENLTVTQLNTGIYDYSFVNPLPNAEYVVVGNATEDGTGLFTDYNLYTTNQSNTGFTVTIASGDNSNTQDVPTNVPHSIVVYGGTSVISSITSSDDVPEGAVNEYYTDTKAITAARSDLLDEDDFTSNSDQQAPTQQSTAAYINSTAEKFRFVSAGTTPYSFDNQIILPGVSSEYVIAPGIEIVEPAGESYLYYDGRARNYVQRSSFTTTVGGIYEVVINGSGTTFIREIQTRPNRFVTFTEREVTVSVTNDSTSYLTLDADIPFAGDYEISYSIVIRHNQASSNYRFRCLNTTKGVAVGYNGATGYYDLEPKDGGADIRIPHTIVAVQNLDAGINNFDLQFGRSNGAGTTTMYYAIITVKEVN
jgi:hypothetical protein